MNIKQSRVITGPLAVFDLALGLAAVGLPGVYMRFMHTSPHQPYMLARTGVVWLFFSACEFAAFANPVRFSMAVFLTAMLRLMDVPADITYRVTAPHLSALGSFSLIFAPVFNTCAGFLLLYMWKKI